MTNEEILEKQVEALEKLLQLRAAIIEELEAKVNKLEAEKFNIPNHFPGLQQPGWITTPWIGQPQYPGIGGGSIIISNTCPDGSLHTWSGLGTPCTKCGQYGSTLTTVSTTGYVDTNLADQNQATSVAPNNVLTLTNAAK